MDYTEKIKQLGEAIETYLSKSINFNYDIEMQQYVWLGAKTKKDENIYNELRKYTNKEWQKRLNLEFKIITDGDELLVPDKTTDYWFGFGID